jgi:hypothetical protein
MPRSFALTSGLAHCRITPESPATDGGHQSRDSEFDLTRRLHCLVKFSPATTAALWIHALQILYTLPGHVLFRHDRLPRPPSLVYLAVLAGLPWWVGHCSGDNSDSCHFLRVTAASDALKSRTLGHTHISRQQKPRLEHRLSVGQSLGTGGHPSCLVGSSASDLGPLCCIILQGGLAGIFTCSPGQRKEPLARHESVSNMKHLFLACEDEPDGS